MQLILRDRFGNLKDAYDKNIIGVCEKINFSM